MNIKIPTDAELPAKLAEVMEWKPVQYGPKWVYDEGSGVFVPVDEWKPLTDRNHSRLAVEECARNCLWNDYVCNLWLVKYGPDEPFLPSYRACFNLALVDPAQESRAAYLTLEQHRLTKGTP